MFIMQVGYGTLARVSKIRVDLLSVWGSDVYDFPKESNIKKRILEKNILYANNIASTSNVMAKEVKIQVPKFKKNIYITPFGVDIDKFKKYDKVYEKNNESNGYIYIGNVKALKAKYGIEYSILAFKELKEQLIKENKIELANLLKMKIYGDGEEKEKLKRLILDNELQDEIFLMGKIPNNRVPDVLNELDIFCATSILNSESFGVAVVEAMACEIPVVATDVDGFKEVMQNEITGFIVKRGDIKGIADALYKLVENKELRYKFGKNGRERVKKMYDFKENVEKMKMIYFQLMGEK